VDDSLIDMWSKSGSKEDVWSGKMNKPWDGFEEHNPKASTTLDTVKHRETFFSLSGGHVSKWNFSFSKGGESWKVECLLWLAFHFWSFVLWYLYPLGVTGKNEKNNSASALCS
jgi:hypothetical protein